MIFISCLIQQRAHIFLGLPCVACRNNLLTLQMPHQFQLQLSFNFPSSVPTCPGNISVFPFGCLSLLLPPYCSFLHLKLVRTSPFSHAGLLLYLLSILNIRMDCSAALRRLSLKIKQLSWVSLPSRADSQEMLFTSSLNKLKSTCLKFWVIIILLAFLTSLRLLTSHLMTLQPSIPKTVIPYSGAAGPASTSQFCPAPAPKCCPWCIPYISQIPYPHHTAPSSRCGEFHVLKGFSLWSEKQTHFLITSLVHELTAEYSYWDFIAKVPAIRAHCRITDGIHTM